MSSGAAMDRGGEYDGFDRERILMDETNGARRKRYDSDLRDDEWELIAPSIPKPKPGGRPRDVDIREVVNGIFYLLKTGCQWRALPHDFPPWQTVNWYCLIASERILHSRG